MVGERALRDSGRSCRKGAVLGHSGAKDHLGFDPAEHVEYQAE